MMTNTKLNTITWTALIILISLSYFFAETSFQNAALLIALGSIVKFTAVGFQFMETKKANILWQILLLLFVLLYFIAVIIFY